MPHARILLYKPKLILFRQDFSGPLMCQQKLGIGESRCSISLIFWQQSAYTFPMEPPCESCSEKAQALVCGILTSGTALLFTSIWSGLFFPLLTLYCSSFVYWVK